jgi:hypothetical protein
MVENGSQDNIKTKRKGKKGREIDKWLKMVARTT